MRIVATLLLVFVAGWGLAQQQQQSVTGLATTGAPLAAETSPLAPVLSLLRDGKTAEARPLLEQRLRQTPADVELLYQMARSHLIDFYSNPDPNKRRVSLSLALEWMDQVLRRDANHIPTLRAKAVIHARAELLHYDPNLAYELAARVVKLEPHAHEYLLNLSDWLSGEVRFTHEDHAASHRVPHDPLLGLDRALAILNQVADHMIPFSPEESAAYFQLGKTLSRRGNFAEAIVHLKRALKRAQSGEQKREVLRELGTASYRLGDFGEAARQFYEALQWGGSPIDQWLLHVAMAPMRSPPSLPQSALFPIARPAPQDTRDVLLEFKDVAAELGVNRLDGNGTSAWGDYDGDGDLDLIVSGSGAFLALYRNDGNNRFVDATASAGLADVPSGYSLNLIDYDNDSRLDLYVALNGWSGPMRNRLFRNTGNGRFEDVSAKSGADDPGSGFVSLWGDLDNDGFLDLVVANGVLKDGSVTELYRNRGDGTFEKMPALQEPSQWGAIGIALGDYDKDGDLDLFINGLDGAPNRLYRNDGKWRFREVAARAGVQQAAHNGFVAFFVDYNNDTWPDLITTSLAPWDAVVDGLREGYQPESNKAVHPDSTRLFRNNNDGTFTDVTFEAKLYLPAGSMGAGVADLDNDGFVDLYLGTGDPQLTRLEPNRLFRNRGDGTFVDLTQMVGFARSGNKGHGVTFVDLDNDGDLEIYAQLGGHYPGDHAHNALYRNLKGSRNHWLGLELRGVRSNRFAVGAQVTVRAGDAVFYREVKGSEGFGSTDPYRVHIGLGRRAKVEQVDIRWPSGTVQRLGAMEVDRVVQVVETDERRRP
jgi:tetratricopeptide (TPR) repeat protein